MRSERNFFSFKLILRGGHSCCRACSELFRMRLIVVHHAEEVQTRGEESKTGAYQALEFDSMDHISMYSKIHKQQTPVVEMSDLMHAIIDSIELNHLRYTRL